jgi:hypothetical protein
MASHAGITLAASHVCVPRAALHGSTGDPPSASCNPTSLNPTSRNLTSTRRRGVERQIREGISSAAARGIGVVSEDPRPVSPSKKGTQSPWDSRIGITAVRIIRRTDVRTDRQM